MPKELEQVFEAFDRNARVNRAVLSTLDMRDLDHSDGVGGFTIGQHLADIVGFRRDWLMRVSPEHAQRIADATDEAAPNWLRAERIEDLQAAFDEGDAAIRDAVRTAVNEGRRFEAAYASHPSQLIVHCIVHDAHHRGQVLALLRQAGRPAEERERLETATWPIWRE